ncbi:MAG: DUF2750 domain-containing protein [Hyphomicrobium sp.]|nr:DUF2750 domain-containing protein [Hyphomicrobium sp.]
MTNPLARPMLYSPIDSANAVRDAFLAAVTPSRAVFGVVGADGLARVPSHKFRGREVSLFWSSRAGAEAMADTVTTHPRIKTFGLVELMSSVLPGLKQHRRLVGLNWAGGPMKAELDPVDLGERLRLAALDGFVSAVRMRNTIWTLEGPAGPALLVSQTRPDVLVLPCWSDAGAAVERIEGPWREMMPAPIELDAFVSRRLPWLRQNGHLVGPEHAGGPGALEMQPDDLALRLEMTEEGRGVAAGGHPLGAA